jgi:hypothetical protein
MMFSVCIFLMNSVLETDILYGCESTALRLAINMKLLDICVASSALVKIQKLAGKLRAYANYPSDENASGYIFG